jgi:hypothetical protein
VLGLGGAARPACEPAAEDERDLGLAQGPGRFLHRIEQLLELAILAILHGARFPARGGRGT